MKTKNKWLPAIAAAIVLGITWLDHDSSVYAELSPAALVPVIVIAAVIVFLKAGVLSAILIGLKNLWERIRRK